MGRILHLISQLEEGGAQRSLSNVVALSKRHQVEVAALIASPPEKLFPFFRNSPVPIHFLSNSADFYYAGILPSLRKLLREQQYDVVQCWLFEAIIQGIFASRSENVPCIASPRSLLFMMNTYHKRWERILIRKALSAADLVLFPSYSAAIDFTYAGLVSSANVRVARNGVDCHHFQPNGTGTALVAVGRLSTEKGFDFLERVFARLRISFPQLRCLVAGGGEIRSYPGLEHLGYTEDVREVYKQAAIYISTSWVEGMSMALLESQAMGIPAVVRRIGSNSEVIEHGLNGFLAQSEEEYVAACSTLLGNAVLRQTMSIKARAMAVERFPIEKQVDDIEAIHHELL